MSPLLPCPLFLCTSHSILSFPALPRACCPVWLSFLFFCKPGQLGGLRSYCIMRKRRCLTWVFSPSSCAVRRKDTGSRQEGGAGCGMWKQLDHHPCSDTAAAEHWWQTPSLFWYLHRDWSQKHPICPCEQRDLRTGCHSPFPLMGGVRIHGVAGI